MNELAKEIYKSKLDTCALQEIRQPGKDCDKKELYDFI